MPTESRSDLYGVISLIQAETGKYWRTICIVAAVLILFNLFYLGAKPFAVGLIPTPWDKLAHFAVFSGLAVLMWLGTAGRMTVWIIVVAGGFGALDELHQAFLPGRSADIADWMADFTGALTAGVALSIYAGRRLPWPDADGTCID